MNTKEQTSRQRKALIQTLIMLRKGSAMDGMSTMRFMRETYGIDEDWHVYSEILDYLTRIDVAQETGINSDGMNQYYIK